MLNKFQMIDDIGFDDIGVGGGGGGIHPPHRHGNFF